MGCKQLSYYRETTVTEESHFVAVHRGGKTKTLKKTSTVAKNRSHFAFAQVTRNSSNTHAELRLSEYEAPASGFIVLYLSNESRKLTEVYFDDLKVTVTESKVVQRDDYYPFGLSFNSWKRSTARENKYLYQGKEQQDDLDLGTFDFHARMYDPFINRTWQLDPMSDAFDHLSPYSWVANNPLKFVDPTGMYMVDVETEYEKRERKRKEEEEKRKREEEEKRRKAERERKRNKKDKPSTCPDCTDDENKASGMELENEKGVGMYNDFEGEHKNGEKNTPGGDWDFWGVGSVPYKGKRLGGTNFIGDGPDGDPRTFGLQNAVDEIDAAAYFHDLFYFKLGVSGFKGARFNTDVRFADLQLVNWASSIMTRYHQGGIDQITQQQISQRTYNLSKAVYMFFVPIVIDKFQRMGEFNINIQYPRFK